MIVNVSSAVTCFANTVAHVRRRGEAVLNPDTGVFEDGDESIFDSTGSFQPLSGKELATLESLEDVKNTKAYYTLDVLRITNKELGHLADILEIDGETYEVRNIEHWEVLGAYQKVLLTKITNRRNIDNRD